MWKKEVEKCGLSHFVEYFECQAKVLLLNEPVSGETLKVLS